MSRCRICGGSGCDACNSPQRPHATAGDLFDSFLSESLPVSPGTISGDSGKAPSPAESVWVSARLDYFRQRAGAWPIDIGFFGCPHPPDGSYRILDPFWLSWLHSRVERLQGAAKAQGRGRLREIVIEAINAGGLPEAYDDSEAWPRIVPAGYEPPDCEISTKFWPAGIDDFGHVR